jgi:solute carrier family 25 carnitine/acylcarnitine transporter 20/29
MRLWAFVFAVVPLVSSQSSQLTFSSTTLVDVLSADPDYTSLLHLLQRAKLIPTLNRLNGSTFFAPTNDAIKRHSLSNSRWGAILEDDHYSVNDNVQEELRQELFYHLLNYSLPESLPHPNLQVLKTLHFPTNIDPSPTEPPPWLPVPGGTLGGEPQRLRMYSRDAGAWVGVDALGKGGAEIVKGQVDAGNGVLLGISDVLTVPPDLGQWYWNILSQSSHQSYNSHCGVSAVIRFIL